MNRNPEMRQHAWILAGASFLLSGCVAIGTHMEPITPWDYWSPDTSRQAQADRVIASASLQPEWYETVADSLSSVSRFLLGHVFFSGPQVQAQQTLPPEFRTDG